LEQELSKENSKPTKQLSKENSKPTKQIKSQGKPGAGGERERKGY